MELKTIFEKALRYENYRKEVDALVAEGKTTGAVQTPELLEYTKLNIQRMNRLDKTVALDEQTLIQLSQLDHNYKWLLVGDAWCGDCAQIIPIINKMSEADGSHIDFRIISRDAVPGLIETLNENKSRSIPKLVMMDADTYETLHIWGARPLAAHEILLHYKANQNVMSKEDFEKQLHLWYAKDRGQNIMREVTALI
jgi:thiol-disulfide isomerase/thioredoxin